MAGAASVAPLTPHPWDSASRKRTLLESVVVTLLMTPIVLLRIVVLVFGILLLACGLVLCRAGPLWDGMLCVAGRLGLFAFGVWPGMLSVRGTWRFADAPITVVAPHCGMLEACFFMHRGQPRPIALEPYTKIPVIGGIFKRAQGVAVPLPAATTPGAGGGSKKPPRSGGSSATAAVREAIEAHKRKWRDSPPGAKRQKPIGILPEGTTHNGISLLTFFSGAFEGGGPVQPVLMHYPKTCRLNAAYFSSTLGNHLLTLLLVPWQRMSVRYLPVYHPSAEEEADAAVYAENVRRSMAAASGLPLSEYGARELRRGLKAQSQDQGPAATKEPPPVPLQSSADVEAAHAA